MRCRNRLPGRRRQIDRLGHGPFCTCGWFLTRCQEFPEGAAQKSRKQQHVAEEGRGDEGRHQPAEAGDEQQVGPGPLGNLGSQLAIGVATGGESGSASTAPGLMQAARTALANPQVRTAATLGATQAGNEAAQLAAEGKPVSGDQLAAMAATATAANLIPLAGRWSLPARVTSGAVVGEATNEANNVVSGRPLVCASCSAR